SRTVEDPIARRHPRHKRRADAELPHRLRRSRLEQSADEEEVLDLPERRGDGRPARRAALDLVAGDEQGMPGGRKGVGPLG
ncbi:MAG: hypothetical protein ACRDZ5_12300, partial [Acidimicrobiales bacterium]